MGTLITILLMITETVLWSSSCDAMSARCEMPKQKGELTYSCNGDPKGGLEPAYQEAVADMETFLVGMAPFGMPHSYYRPQKYKGVGTLYGYAECFFDGSDDDCRACLSKAVEGIQMFCPGSVGAQYTVPPDAACCMRYEKYPFTAV